MVYSDCEEYVKEMFQERVSAKMRSNEAKTIYFDMDGTLADLFGVEGWMPAIRSGQTFPYEIAEPIHNDGEFKRVIKKLRDRGYHIGIVTWGSMVADDDFDRRTRKIKREWIRRHVGAVDEFRFSRYGIPKYELVSHVDGALLVDDDPNNLKAWAKRGNPVLDARNPKKVMSVLQKLAACA